MANLKKNYKRLTPEQPPRCIDCPLLGKIPDAQCEGKYTHVCCATGDPITGRGMKVNAVERRKTDPKHPWQRSCDGGIWEAWYNASVHHVLKIPLDRYITWRQPYEHSLGLKINFPKR